MIMSNGEVELEKPTPNKWDSDYEDDDGDELLHMDLSVRFSF